MSTQARSSIDPAAEVFKLGRTRDAWVFVRATVFFSVLATWTLRETGNEAGLAFVRQAGPNFAYWAIFRPRGGEAATITL